MDCSNHLNCGTPFQDIEESQEHFPEKSKDVDVLLGNDRLEDSDSDDGSRVSVKESFPSFDSFKIENKACTEISNQQIVVSREEQRFSLSCLTEKLLSGDDNYFVLNSSKMAKDQLQKFTKGPALKLRFNQEVAPKLLDESIAEKILSTNNNFVALDSCNANNNHNRAILEFVKEHNEVSRIVAGNTHGCTVARQDIGSVDRFQSERTKTNEKDARILRNDLSRDLELVNDTIALLKLSWETKSSAVDDWVLKLKMAALEENSRSETELIKAKLKIANLEKKCETMDATVEELFLKLRKSECESQSKIVALESKYDAMNAAMKELLLKVHSAGRFVAIKGEEVCCEVNSTNENMEKLEDKTENMRIDVRDLMRKFDMMEKTSRGRSEELQEQLDFTNDALRQLETRYQTQHVVVKDTLSHIAEEAENMNQTLFDMRDSMDTAKENVTKLENKCDAVMNTVNEMVTKLEKAEQNNKIVSEELDLTNKCITKLQRNFQKMSSNTDKLLKNTLNDEAWTARTEKLFKELDIATKTNNIETEEHRWNQKSTMLDQMLEKLKSVEETSKKRSHFLRKELELAKENAANLEAKFDAKRSRFEVPADLESARCNSKILKGDVVEEVRLVKHTTTTLESNLKLSEAVKQYCAKLGRGTKQEVSNHSDKASPRLRIVAENVGDTQNKWVEGMARLKPRNHLTIRKELQT